MHIIIGLSVGLLGSLVVIASDNLMSIAGGAILILVGIISAFVK